MKLHFYKLDGAGNDFVGLDWRKKPLPENGEISAMTRKLCHRQHGVGADGVLMLCDPKPGSGEHFRMIYVNADGSIGEMCGNGARCIATFAHHCGAAPTSMVFQTDAGTYQAQILPDSVSIKFPDIKALPETRTLEGSAQHGRKAQFLLVGVPHAVIKTPELEFAEVHQTGREIRHDPAFGPAGSNVNFTEFADGLLHVRTYERGVEAETLACGTGSVASVCCHLFEREIRGPVEIAVRPTSGEILHVAMEAISTGFRNISLRGPARIVFEGDIEYENETHCVG